ncbi:MAG: SusC/RagA family TonB-linked outer membrane protein, partial [Segetibacter sp.]
SIGLYQPQGEYSVGSQYAGNAAIQNSDLANPDLQWEQSKTFNFGSDIGLFNNRFSILFDTYRRVTSNLLTTLALPRYTGFNTVYTNLGSLENEGIELELGAQVFSSKSTLQWNVSFNAARVRNKILKLPFNNIENNRVGGFLVWDPSRGDYAWLGGLQEGGRIGNQFAYKQIGIYATDAEAAKGPLDTQVPGTNKTKYGGDVNWADLDANGTIDSRDRVEVGNIYPTWTGGFSNSLRYKNLNLVIRMDYTTGHTIYNEPKARLVGQFSGQAGLSTDVLRSWQKEGDITDIPKFYWADQQAQNNLFRGNSYYYQLGDFLALRELTLGYTLPAKLLNSLKLNNARFTLSGNNLHYFTKYTGLNPEEGGTDAGRYPIPRSVVFGANITL